MYNASLLFQQLVKSYLQCGCWNQSCLQATSCSSDVFSVPTRGALGSWAELLSPQFQTSWTSCRLLSSEEQFSATHAAADQQLSPCFVLTESLRVGESKQEWVRGSLAVGQYNWDVRCVSARIKCLVAFVPQCSSNTWRANREHSKNSKSACKNSWRPVSTWKHVIYQTLILLGMYHWAVEVEVAVDLVGLFLYNDYKWAHLFQVWMRTDDKTGMNRLTVEHLASVSQEFVM